MSVIEGRRTVDHTVKAYKRSEYEDPKSVHIAAYRRISSKFRPVEAGYAIKSLMTFFGSITKTVRTYAGVSVMANPIVRNFRANRERETLGVNVRCIQGIQHVVQPRDLTALVGNLCREEDQLNCGPRGVLTDDRKLDVSGADFGPVFIDVLHPVVMVLEPVG